MIFEELEQDYPNSAIDRVAVLADLIMRFPDKVPPVLIYPVTDINDPTYQKAQELGVPMGYSIVVGWGRAMALRRLGQTIKAVDVHGLTYEF